MDDKRFESVHPKVKEICKPLMPTDTVLRKMMEVLNKEMNLGLEGGNSCLKMLPSFVRALPNGTEKGNFLALDLGGTNFRVLLITLNGKKAAIDSKIYRLPERVMTGTATQLFDHIASCVASFIQEKDLDDDDEEDEIPLGFTFSFPVEQNALNAGKLTNWTKGFSASGCVGRDVVELLEEACERREDVDVDIVALLNDTVGTLMACAFKDKNCRIGVILGTGNNACYMEQLSNCPKLRKYRLEEDNLPNEMIINIEWGALGNDGCIEFLRTIFDEQIDKNSINPGSQILEKMIGGMYLGEMVRYVLVKLMEEKLLFDGHCDIILKPNVFYSKYVSEIDGEKDGFTKTQQILQEMGIDHEVTITDSDCMHIAYACSLISTRAAYLCAAGIACLINRIKKPFVTVGIDGSVYKFHPDFGTILDEKINDLVQKQYRYKLMLSEDGSGKGAALIAAVATQMKKEE